MIKHQKPNTFYDVFTRKETDQKVTHYCPGCGHGNAHKLIAELIDELGIQDRTVFVSPVGCSVFAYYYLDVGNIEAAHGRAPSVATGIRRSHKDAIVIAYQGDGDLAGIGMGSIVHAANRGENVTVFFINNAIYGMTGGQMAPTTLLGQKTQTSPLGRTSGRDGNPVGMCELIDSLKLPVYIERVSLGNPARIMRARRAFKKGLQNQIEGKGFSFIEVLSPCPVNWKMTPLEAKKWVIDKLEPVYPVKKFRDTGNKIDNETAIPKMKDKELLSLFNVETDVQFSEERKSIDNQLVKIAGFGGQGVMSAGVLLADCATKEGLHSTWLPSYGPEMRGGTANASVIVSSEVIGSPVVNFPNVLITMNAPSLETFEPKVKPGGLILINASIIKKKVQRDDVRAVYVPATELAKEAGLIATSNVVILTVYLLITGIISIDTLKEIIPLSIKKKNLTDVNLKAIQAGVDFYTMNNLSV
jgi:2-oxoisovalerate ferredoxin oxidoreductase beta subunit